MKKMKLSNNARAIIWIAVTLMAIVVTLYALYFNTDVMSLVGAIGLLWAIVGVTMLNETEFDKIHDGVQTLSDEKIQLLNILRRRENENYDTINRLYDAVRINNNLERLKVVNKIIEEDNKRMAKLTEELSKL